MSDKTELVDKKKDRLAEKEAELEKLIAKIGFPAVVLTTSLSLFLRAFVSDIPYAVGYLVMSIANYLDPHYSFKFEDTICSSTFLIYATCFVSIGVFAMFLKHFGCLWKKPALYWPLTLFWAMMSMFIGFITVTDVHFLLFKCKSDEVACSILYIIGRWTITVKLLFEALDLKKQNEKVDFVDESKNEKVDFVDESKNEKVDLINEV